MVAFITNIEHLARVGQRIAEKRGVIRRLEAELDEHRKAVKELLAEYREIKRRQG